LEKIHIERPLPKSVVFGKGHFGLKIMKKAASKNAAQRSIIKKHKKIFRQKLRFMAEYLRIRTYIIQPFRPDFKRSLRKFVCAQPVAAAMRCFVRRRLRPPLQ
jgi:hypothetical protein